GPGVVGGSGSAAAPVAGQAGAGRASGGTVSIGKNTALGMGTTLIVFGLGVLLSVVLRRNLGPVVSGIYVLLVTTNALLANVVNLSLGPGCTTMLAQGRYRLGEVH